MRPSLMRLLAVPVLACVAAGSARADVIVVDPAGAPGGTLLQGAIDSAQNADILLLRAGDYTDVDITVSGKVLTLVADPPGAQVTLRHLSLILPATLGETALVRGVDIQAQAETSTPPGSGITVQGPFGSQAAAWLEDCTATASLLDGDGPGGLPANAGAGITCLLGPSVIVRCTATGADGRDAVPGDPASGGGPGVETFLASVAIHEGSFTGGAGGDGAGDGVISTNGGDGLRIVGAVAVLGATLRGGDEGADNPATTKPGAALHLAPGNGSVRDVDAQPGDVVGEGTPSTTFVLDPISTLSTFPAEARTLVVTSPLREGQLDQLTLRGVVGDGVWVWVAHGADLKILASKQGAFVLGAPLPSPIFVGPVTDPAGTLDFPFQMPDLPPSMDGTVIYLQSVMTPAGGGLVTGDGSALVWLDGSL